MNELVLLERVERLEKKNARLRKMIGVTFIMAAFLTAVFVYESLGYDLFPRKQLRVESMVLQDSQGNLRAELTAKNNLTLFSFYNQAGYPSMAMSVVDGEPGYHLYGPNGTRRAVFGIAQQGPNMIFMNDNGIPEYVTIPNEQLHGEPITYTAQKVSFKHNEKRSG